MQNLSKLQIRAKVLSVISRIKSMQAYSEDILFSFIDELNEIEDKKTVFDVFIKEYIKLDETQYSFSSLILKEIIPVEYINEKTIEMLKEQSLSDEYKYKLVQLLRITGASCDYNEIPSYFDNPEEVLDKETKRLLDNAVFNPEAMLDFLDFVSAVSNRDRYILISSLKNDYPGDVFVNIVYPILYSDFEDNFLLVIIDLLSESKSSLAIKPFNYLIKTTDNEQILNACKTGLKKLKLAGATEEAADEYYKKIVETSAPAEFFTTIPDGSGNQALLISRSNLDKYMLTAIVINDRIGIVDCFGFFNIRQEEIIKIIGKFYSSEGKYKVSPEYIKTRVLKAIDTTIKRKQKFPYEFICWLPVLSDIEPLEFSLEDYLKYNCKRQLVTKENIIDILTGEYTLRWFITPDENKVIKNWVNKIYTEETLNIDELNNEIKTNYSKVFDEETTLLWKDRIYNLIFLLRTNNKLKEADIFYTMLQDEEYFGLFQKIIVQRSIFCYFVSKKEMLKNTALTTNIFRKRNSSEQEFDLKKIEQIIQILQRSWING